MDVSDLLRNVKANQDAFERAKLLYQDRLAPDFSPFDFIEPDEMRLSSILAWLLNPKATHGQNGRFLHLFVEQLFRSRPELAWPLETCNEAKARTEVWVSSGKLDVLVTSGERTLLIENKAGAGDQPGQIRRYAAYLDSLKQDDTRLIYLTPDGSEPSKESICEQQRIKRIADGQLHCWSYREHILEWLAECRAACRADRVSTFTDEFARHIRKRFEGIADMTMQNRLINDVTRSVQTLAPAMQIITAANGIRNKLLSNLKEELAAKIADTGWKLDGNLSEGTGSGLNIDFSQQSTCFFRVEFESRGYNGFVYGFIKKDNGRPDDGGVRAALTAEFGQACGDSASLWPWWRYASPTDDFLPFERDCRLTETPWVAIADGTMAGVIIKTADCFCKAMDRCGLL